MIRCEYETDKKQVRALIPPAAPMPTKGKT